MTDSSLSPSCSSRAATGLEGQYEIETKFDPATLPMARDVGVPLQDLPAFSSALRNDLGLRLEAERRPIPLLIVEHVGELVPN